MQTIFVAVTHTARSHAQTGVQTVVRGLLRGLKQRHVVFQPVRWSNWRRRLLPSPPEFDRQFDLKTADARLTKERLTGSWLLVPEIMYGNAQLGVLRHARKAGMRVAALFHDAIPVLHPELVRKQAARYHAEYMTALCQADLLLPISKTSADDFRAFANEHGWRTPPIEICTLAADPPDARIGFARSGRPDFANIVYVSSLEPRKNHKTLLEAFALASAHVTQRPLRLHLVGDRYKDAGHIAQMVESAAQNDRDIIWHREVNAAEISNIYRDADFSVFASMLEGFGLPILESLAHGRPCICANFGAMAEVAAGGGCLTVDVRDAAKLAEAIVSLSTQEELRQDLIHQIENRHIKTWAEYAEEIARALAGVEALS